jgi:hypothetical protein
VRLTKLIINSPAAGFLQICIMIVIHIKEMTQSECIFHANYDNRQDDIPQYDAF